MAGIAAAAYATAQVVGAIGAVVGGAASATNTVCDVVDRVNDSAARQQLSEQELAAKQALLNCESQRDERAIAFVDGVVTQLVPEIMFSYDSYLADRLQRKHMARKMELDVCNQQLQLIYNMMFVRQEMEAMMPVQKQKWWKKLCCCIA